MNKHTKKDRYAVFEIEIPYKYHPRKKGNSASLYSKKMQETLSTMHDIELSMGRKHKDVKSHLELYIAHSKIGRPDNRLFLSEIALNYNAFYYEYENYCLRLHIYREMLFKYISQFMDIKVKNICDDTLSREIGISSVLGQFEQKNSVLKELIEYRNKLTHRDFITPKNSDIADMKITLSKVNKSLTKLAKLQVSVAGKIIAYKQN